MLHFAMTLKQFVGNLYLVPGTQLPVVLFSPDHFYFRNLHAERCPSLAGPEDIELAQPWGLYPHYSTSPFCYSARSVGWSLTGIRSGQYFISLNLSQASWP